MVVIILSKIDPNKLELAVKITEKASDSQVIFLSDALYLALNHRYRDTLEKMRSFGAVIYALKIDVTKRDVKLANEIVEDISYKDLVEILMQSGGKVINL